MTDATLARFIADCRERMSASPEPADCVLAITPVMRRLVMGGREFLEPRHFEANPDHIHRSGVAHDREQTVSLHLYGREMNSFHIYDVEAGTRRLVDVAYNES